VPVAALAELAADPIVVNVDQAKLSNFPAAFRPSWSEIR